MSGAHTALFFYAGHGLQVAGKNYAIPIDAKLDSAADLPVETVEIDQVLSVMQADENRVNIVFLDACRNNPLTRSFVRSLPATRALSVGAGLSPVDPGRGTLIAFSTAPDRVALDGKGRNSPFTAALLRHIDTPGLDIALVLRRVTADVEKASGGAQVPWVHASLTTEVILDPAKGQAAPPATAAPAPGPGADELVWGLLRDTKDAGQLQRFIQEFPSSARRGEAEARIASLGKPSTAPAQSARSAPNGPLPPDMPVDAGVLRQVETDPFFANAPPVSVGAYRVDSTTRATDKDFDSRTSANDDVTVRWLRRGIIATHSVYKDTSTVTGKISHFTNRSRWIMAANGLVFLAGQGVVQGNSGPSRQVTKVLRIENLSGHIFPLAVGNRFAYGLVSNSELVYSGSVDNSEMTTKNSCEVTRRYDARQFNVALKGSAYLLQCMIATHYRKNPASVTTSQDNNVFFDQLGIWVAADPILAREHVILTGPASSSAPTMVITGSFALKSVSLAQ